MRTLIVLLLLTALPAAAQQKTITYRWLNQPCAQNLNCDEGCSACNLADEQDGVLAAAGADWIGVDACPHPFALGDNAVMARGWGMAPQADRAVVFTVVTLAPMQVDSIRLVHRNWEDGPERVTISFADALDGTYSVVYDGPVSDAFTTIALTDLGCLRDNTAGPGGLRLKVQAYGATTGAWVLDEVRFVLAPCEVIVTEVPELLPTQDRSTVVPVDVLGRPVIGMQAASGLYIGTRKRVQVAH